MIFGAAHRRRSWFHVCRKGSGKGRCRCGVKKRPLSPPVGVKIVVIVMTPFPFRACLKENDIEPPTVDMERHGAVGGFRMCAGLMLRRHALKVGHVVIGGKKNAAPGAKKHGRKAKSAEAKS